MRYTLEVYVPKSNFWFIACKTNDMIFLGHQILKLKKANHKYRVSKEKKQND